MLAVVAADLSPAGFPWALGALLLGIGLFVSLAPLSFLDRRWLAPVLVLATGSALTTGGFAYFHHLERQRVEAEFTRRCTILATGFQRALDGRMAALNAIASFYAASDEVRRDEFRTFAATVRADTPGILALEWVPRLTDAERAASEAVARSEGFPDFQITERDPADDRQLVPASWRPEYYPVYFIDPVEGNGRVLGFDLATEPARKAALDRARDSGRMAATGRVRLVQGRDERFAILMVVPVYQKGRPHESIPERRANLKGFGLAVFPINEIVRGAIAPGMHEHFTVLVKDRTAASRDAVLFESYASQDDLPAGPEFEKTFDVAGRMWSLHVRPTAAFVAEQQTGQRWSVLAIGIIITSLLGAIVTNAAVYTRRIEHSESELQEALAGMRLAQREAALLDRVTQQVNVGVGLGQILDFVFESFEAIIPYDRISYAMIEEDGRLVRSHWARSRSDTPVINANFCAPLPNSSLEGILASGTPRIIGDLEAYQREHPLSVTVKAIVAEGMRSSLTCPLYAMGKAVGFLFFNSTERDAYREEHVQTFSRIANQLALTVFKGHLYDEVGEELQRSQERFALAVRGTDAGIWDWDLKTGRVYFSPRWKSILGYSEDEIESCFEEWESRIHPEDRDRAMATIRGYLEGRSPAYELEHRLRHKDGSYRWIIARGAAVCDAQGTPYRMVGSQIDVTDRKLAEDSIRDTNAQLLAAQKIQEHLLPKSPPSIPGLDIAGACYPASYTAGDYFDYFVLDDGSLILMVADVVGHGFGPALLAATIHAHLRSIAGNCLGLEEIASRLNRLLCQTVEADRFVTLFLACLDPRTLSLRYVNAGHPPGCILDASGAVKALLDGSSFPLGIEPATTFPVSRPISLAAGDLLLMMTDGIIETLSPDDHQFGMDRALELVRANLALGARELIAAIRDATLAFAHRRDLLDDLTVVVLKVEEATRAAPDASRSANLEALTLSTVLLSSAAAGDGWWWTSDRRCDQRSESAPLASSDDWPGSDASL